MDRKQEVRQDLWNILKDVYKLNEEKGVTDKQNEFLDKAVAYLDSTISLRRKVVKEKTKEPELEISGYVNPDRARFDT